VTIILASHGTRRYVGVRHQHPAASDAGRIAHQHCNPNHRPPGAGACSIASAPMTIALLAGFSLPVLLGHQLALHLDQADASLGCGLWSDHDGHTTTLGADLGRLRLRLVIDRTEGRTSTGWGLL
jgi:hypothetical protein